MKILDFKIGEPFWCSGHRWLCTDIGTRTIVAIPTEGKTEDWLTGPPYAVTEIVFDEHDFPVCSTTSE